jgi:hypothetical protein
MTERKTMSPSDNPDTLMLLWLAFAGLLLFSYYLLWVTGIWKLLFEADPTGITALTVLVFTGSTVWVGLRVRTLRAEHQALLVAKGALPAPGHGRQTAITQFLNKTNPQSQNPPDTSMLVQVLADRLHGPNEFMW